MARNKFRSALRVALITSLGGGFGFAFGNFLQIIGNILEINFNMWNVMEYSIVFFGGVSMAYGVFSSYWPEESYSPEKWENKTSLLIVFVFIPFIVFSQSLGYNRFLDRFKDLPNPQLFALLSSLSAVAVFIITAILTCYRVNHSVNGFRRKDVILILLTYFAAYITLSYIVTGALTGKFLLNHHLYWVNYFIILFLLRKKFPAFLDNLSVEFNGKRWLLWVTGILIFIIILALILVNIHGEIPGSNNRFQV
jgi:uncharacterized membrane protein